MTGKESRELDMDAGTESSRVRVLTGSAVGKPAKMIRTPSRRKERVADPGVFPPLWAWSIQQEGAEDGRSGVVDCNTE